jgi:hypothetical protein
MKHSIILLSLFTLLSLNLRAGNKYISGCIISLKGDTIRGYLLPQSGMNASSKCYFRETPGSDSKVYRPDEIAGYRFSNGKFYISKQIKDATGASSKPVFMEFLIKGIVSIYYMMDDAGEHYYIEKATVGLVELTEPVKITEIYLAQPKYTGKLKYIMQDCPEIQGEIEKTELKYKSLINLARDYHHKVCTDYECIIYERQETAVKYKFSLLAGITANKYTFGTLLETNSGTGYQAGVGLKIKNAVFSNNRFDIDLGLLVNLDSRYTLKSFSNQIWNIHLNYDDADYIINVRPDNYNNIVSELPVKLKLISMQIPVMFDFNFNAGKVTCFAGAGVTDKFVIGMNKKYKLFDFEQQYGRSFPALMFGAAGKLGCDMKLSRNHSLCLNLMCEYLIDPGAQNSSLRTTGTKYSFQIGYSL